MTAAQEALVQQIWEKRDPDLPVSTIEEFVTLASIVEKETGRADERPRVASVFINRLEKGMRLQSDPTIIYGIFGGEGKPADRAILRSDLDKQTPYNTYLIKGLPRRRSQIRAGRRSKPSPIRRARPNSTSSPTAPVDTSLRRRSRSTMPMCGAGARSRRRGQRGGEGHRGGQDAVTQTGTQQ